MKEKREVENMENEIKPWKYTDDIICILVALAWMIGKFVGVEIPEWVLTTVIGYAFGKNLPIQR